jgi:alpha-L-fucosidase 2
MLIQSSTNEVELLPACPKQWPEGKITGVLTRCGVTVDLEWKDHKPVMAELKAQRKTKLKVIFNDKEWSIELESGQVYNLDIS